MRCPGCGNLIFPRISPAVIVAVTDGEQIVLTDENGVYNIASTKPYGMVYITTPSGYEPVAMDSVRQSFWARTTAEPTELERHDFKLKKVDDSKLSVLFMADTHFCNDPKRNDFTHFRELMMPSINRAAVDADGYKFAVALGDITWDRFWYATGMDIEGVPQHLANHNFPMPFYCVHGNHDYDPSVPATDNPNTNAIQRFCNVFGPTFYSMNKGGIHFVMLDDIVYKNEVKKEKNVTVLRIVKSHCSMSSPASVKCWKTKIFPLYLMNIISEKTFSISKMQ